MSTGNDVEGPTVFNTLINSNEKYTFSDFISPNGISLLSCIQPLSRKSKKTTNICISNRCERRD